MQESKLNRAGTRRDTHPPSLWPGATGSKKIRSGFVLIGVHSWFAKKLAAWPQRSDVFASFALFAIIIVRNS
jgi:hypothetical protein